MVAMTHGYMPPLALQERPELAEMMSRLSKLGFTDEEPKVALAAFQRWHGMDETGLADDLTTGKLFAPRCALPDVMPARAEEAKWHDPNIGFAIAAVALNGLSAGRVRELYAESWDAWRRVCGLLPKEVEFSIANIQAKIGKIDGRSGTLAWSYLVSTGLLSEQLDQLFDISESWTEKFFLEVGTHENGHALGWNHSKSKASIMYPYTTGGRIWVPQPIDIELAVETYGLPLTPPTPPEPWPPTIPGSEVAVVNALLATGKLKLVSVTEEPGVIFR